MLEQYKKLGAENKKVCVFLSVLERLAMVFSLQDELSRSTWTISYSRYLYSS